MIVYKLKHKPTGLYFTPSKTTGNLSRKGKLYTASSIDKVRIPTNIIIVKYCGHKLSPTQKIVADHYGFSDKFADGKWNMVREHFFTPVEEWEPEIIT